MNRYKIDWNTYFAGDYPYALYVKSAWYQRWKFVASFRTKEDAVDLFEKLASLPIPLPTQEYDHNGNRVTNDPTRPGCYVGPLSGVYVPRTTREAHDTPPPKPRK
jgi:hypothetical protein